MFCYVDDTLPEIPQSVLLSLDEVEKLDNVFYGKATKDAYALYPANQDLIDYLQPYFDFKCIVMYQVIRKDLKPHIDKGLRNDYKYNYLINSGDALTHWWQDEKIIHTEKCLEHIWYSINVGIKHSVSNIVSPRLSIIVKH